MSVQRRSLAQTLVSALAAICALSGAAVADSGTWTNNADGLWSAGPNWLAGTVADGAGNTAFFSTIDITNDTKVTVDTARTIGNLMFGDADTNSPAGWTVDNGGVPGNSLTLSPGPAAIGVYALGSGADATISAILAGTVGLAKLGAGTLNLNGNNTLGGKLTVNGGGTLNLGGANAFTDNPTIGDASAGNTVNVADGGTIPSGQYTLSIGAGAFGSNRLIIATPGTAASPSFKAHNLAMGETSSSNSLVVSKGAYLGLFTGNSFWRLGQNAGANSNSLVVTGAGSVLNRKTASGSAIYVGTHGSYNNLTVSDGGVLYPRRISLAEGSGRNNTVLVTGAGSKLIIDDGSNAWWGQGGAGSSSNITTVADRGTIDYAGSGTSRSFSIGFGAAARDNAFIVTGSGSLLAVNYPNLPVGVGGVCNSGSATDGGTGSHLDVSSGGTITMNTSLYLLGSNSAFNLGNGTGISKATVGACTSPYNAGVFLKNADARLNFDNGRLTASAGGTLVSGSGVVSNTGPAFVSTAYTNSIDSVITGPGSLTKEGLGILTLTATNSYTGATVVEVGVLALDVDCLSNGADVYLVTGAKMSLNFSGTDVVRQIYVDGVAQGGGNYGAGKRLSSFFVGDGPGVLRVLGKIGPTVIVR